MEFENKIMLIEKRDGSEDEINLIEILEKFSNQWKWFVFSVFILLSISFAYLRYTPNQFMVSTTIFIDDKESGGLNTELSAFEDLGVLGSGAKTSIINEIGVLKSLTLIENVVDDLDINISYYSIGKVRNQEVYGLKVPINLNFFVKDSILNKLDTAFVITTISKSEYTLKANEEDKGKPYSFGENVNTVFGEINVTPQNISSIDMNEDILVRIRPLGEVANEYRDRIQIRTESKNSSLLILSLNDVIKQKAEHILNNLVYQYNNDAIEYKKLITRNTDIFINDRINDIAVDLTNVDKGVEEFKTKNNLTDIEYEAGLVLSSNSELQKTINDLSSQIKLVDFVIQHLNDNKDALIPANLAIRDEATGQNTVVYNRLLLERDRILKGSSRMNPTVINLDLQISTLRISIEQSLANLKSSLQFSLNEAKNQEYRLNVKRDLAPQQEREYQDIRRKQQIIETLYLYLLEKREENAISLGIPVPNAKIIDRANGSNIPVAPNKRLIYLLAFGVGLIIPITIITGASLLDRKVHSSDDIEKIVKAPILGEIPRTKSNKKIVINEKDEFSVAESFRLLRTNIIFMLSKFENSGKTIFVSSTIPNEGKTFIAINLAISLALLDKKVLLIGADIRKPKIMSYLNLNVKKGLTHYLLDNELKPSDVIDYNKKYDLDILNSGEVPPNPSEMLLNGRVNDVLEYGKENYDYVIVDTAPVSMVTDTLLLGDKADLFLYVIRAEYLDKRLLNIPQKLFENKRLPNMTIVINSSNSEKINYGYGYGYHEDQRPWYIRMFKNFL